MHLALADADCRKTAKNLYGSLSFVPALADNVAVKFRPWAQKSRENEILTNPI